MSISAEFLTSFQICLPTTVSAASDSVPKTNSDVALPVTIVSNSPFRIPDHPLVTRVVVGDGFDAADDWIAERSDAAAIVVTADILLADRCLKAGATVLSPTGRSFTGDSIGGAIATRAIMADLRAGGDAIGGPAPFARADRSRFLQALDAAAVRLRRRQAIA